MAMTAVIDFWRHVNENPAAKEYLTKLSTTSKDPVANIPKAVEAANKAGFNFTAGEYEAVVRRALENKYKSGRLSEDDYVSGRAYSGSLIGCTIACGTVGTCCPPLQ